MRPPVLLLLLTYSLFLLLAGNWVLSLTSIDEGRNADAVRNMLESGDYIFPVYNCQPRFEKPPMLYWLAVFGSHLFGLNEFSLRLVSGLSALGVVFLTYRIALELFSKDVALKSALILATFPHMWIEARAFVPEMLNTFFSMLGLYAFLKGRFLLGWLALALAFLTKGPVGVVLATGIYLLWKRKLDFLKPAGIAVFLLVGSSWYTLMLLEYGYEYFYRFFIYENVMRYTGHRSTHPAPIYYYPLVIAAGTLWYLPLYPKLVKGFRREWLPLFLWFAFVLLFFSLAKNKLHHYILLCYPPLAIMLSQVAGSRYLRVVSFLSFAVLLLLLALLHFYEKGRFTPRAYPAVKTYGGPVYFYRAEDSALVFYSRRCIDRLEDPLRAHGLVITREKHRSELAHCKELLRGREFDGQYVLLECRR